MKYMYSSAVYQLRFAKHQFTKLDGTAYKMSFIKKGFDTNCAEVTVNAKKLCGFKKILSVNRLIYPKQKSKISTV